MVGPARDPGSETDVVGMAAFGKYEPFASLGRGGMADVFLSVAHGQMGFNKLVVIKRLRQALAEETAFRNMFLDEARLAARLSHPNIVHTYEVGEQDGVYFIAMEYLEGQSLNKVLRESLRRNVTIEPGLAVRIVADALAGLGYAHELRDYDGRPLNVIHRDVSPHNIFVTYDGHTKVVDFGIAKAALSSTETEVGVLKGKVAYMSPEQAMGQRIDARSDLFAMGIVLWELLTQQRLMTGENSANTLHRLMNEPVPRVSAVRPAIDPVLDALVARALEKDPSRRWQSAGEMRQALDAWLAASPRPARQDDVGRAMTSLFESVREDVQRQIQNHMSALPKMAYPNDAITADTPRSTARTGGPQAHLPRLGTGGSGSGVVPSYGGVPLASGFPGPMTTHSTAMTTRTLSVLLVVITIGCFLVAGFAIAMLGGRGLRVGALFGRVEGSASSVGSAMPVARPVGSPVVTSPSVTGVLTAPSIPSPTVSVDPPSASSTTPSPLPKTTHGPRNPASAKATASASHAEDLGFVTVSAYPWAKVTEGDKIICAVTPCSRVPMAEGQHTFVFENGESPGQRQTIVVQVKSGETATKNVGFQ